ncbi:MAG: GHKL domain-containing protein [Lachnospiraceae bacterium]|nr:GHKL domain-containing protein [Lachnospiraceae bacterium]
MTDFVFQSLLGIYQPYFDFTEAWLHILRILLSFVLSATIAFLVVKVSKKLRKAINVNAHLQAVFTFASLASWLIFQIVYFAQRIIVGMEIDIWMRILLVGYVVVTLIGFFFYAKHLKSKYVLQQKEDEQKNLLFYMDEIEQQQFAIRKFKHDQQNLFSALDVFVQEKDWDGLLQFYPKVKASSESITKNEFNLEGLANIKVREVKSIFTAKLAMAQHLKLEVKFEAGEEIDEIMGDSVTLVRMFGIILDNAIEELQSLGTGQLLVGCFKVEGSVNVVVQNTCRSDIPPLRQLQQTGYSSKGEGRGLGLSNLYELTNALPNVVLLTNIESGYFTQTLIIGGRV